MWKLSVNTKSRLKFEIKENPSWREGGRRSSAIVRYLALDVIRYSGYPETKSLETEWTQWQCNAAMHRPSERRRLTVAKALLGQCYYQNSKDDVFQSTRFYGVERYRSSERSQKLLTVMVVLEIHTILPINYPQDAGKFRYTQAYTIRHNMDKYEYPSMLQDEFERDMYILIDHHNEHMMYYYENLKSNPRISLESRVKYIIKCAAWLFCRLISLHPFGDGNGRICRMLVSQVMSELMIVSCVRLYNFDNINKDHYLEAIANSQDNSDPGEFAALLVDALKSEWTLKQKWTPSYYLC